MGDVIDSIKEKYGFKEVTPLVRLHDENNKPLLNEERKVDTVFLTLEFTD